MEFGFLSNPDLDGLGLNLYDGGNSGDNAIYPRQGLDHRWDWGEKENDYSFVIQPDGTGLHYDSSNILKGQNTKPKAVYKFYRR